MRARRLLLAAFATAGFAQLLWMPIARAAQHQTMTPTTEAWYQTNPTCANSEQCVDESKLPASSPAPFTADPYPAGTLHIGDSAAQESARTYLAFSFSSLPATPSGGDLNIPLDTAQGDGSLNPDTAVVQICLMHTPIAAAQGSLDQPPQADCSTPVDLSYQATPAPHLHANLGVLASSLRGATGLALIPDLAKSGASANWMVVFSAHDRTGAGATPPASVTLSLHGQPATTASPDQTLSTPPPPATGSSNSGDGSVGVAQPGAAGRPLSQMQLPTGAGTAASASSSTASSAPGPATSPTAVATPLRYRTSATITYVYQYPAVWLIPLGLLVVVPYVGRALTKDLRPATLEQPADHQSEDRTP